MTVSEKRIEKLVKALCDANNQERCNAFTHAPDCVLSEMGKMIAKIMELRKEANETYDCGHCHEHGELH